MESIESCLYRGQKRLGWMCTAGVGDCTICTQDENNKKCRDYTPIVIIKYEIQRKNDILSRPKGWSILTEKQR